MNNQIKIIWRLAVTGLCACFLVICISTLITLVSDWFEERNLGQNIEGYDYYLYDGEYMKLKTRLNSYYPQGDEFRIYWDVADAYECCSLYEFWKLVQENGQADSGEYSGYEEEYLRRLTDIYENSNENARVHIIRFAEDLVR